MEQKQGYIKQMEEWLANNPDATREEVYLAGYWNCNTNWCTSERFNNGN